jgi:hypothetical protein
MDWMLFAKVRKQNGFVPPAGGQFAFTGDIVCIAKTEFNQLNILSLTIIQFKQP